MTISGREFDASDVPGNGAEKSRRRAGSQTVEAEQVLRNEFDQWARDGRGQALETEHLYVTEAAISQMGLTAGMRVLDLSCGTGWATRLLAERVSNTENFGRVIGTDISGEMLNLGRKFSESFENIEFVQASAVSLPFETNAFDRILSVEAFYYYADQGRALEEMYRVLAPGGQVFLLMNIYSDKPSWQYRAAHLPLRVHLRSETEYVQLMKQHSITSVRTTRIRDRWCPPGGYLGAGARILRLFLCPPTQWLPKLSRRLRDARDAQINRRLGALLLIASKPGRPEGA